MSLTEDNFSDDANHGNLLLNRLPRGQRNAFWNQCESVILAAGQVVCETNEPFDYAYFPTSGNISLVKEASDHKAFETEIIGREGMLGTPLILNVRLSPQRGIVQVQSRALRLKANRMRVALQACPALYPVLQRYLYVVLAELTQATACTRFHDVGRRLVRSLLSAQDRSQTDYLRLTHQMLADKLGVQRGAVTIAGIKLQRQGIICYSRGKIFILNRKKLEDASCECYRINVENYARMFS